MEMGGNKNAATNNILTALSGIGKAFIGELIEEAKSI
jgi:hypothetical protein